MKTDSEPAPLVSIGVPTFNEARYIESALSALLAQDYPALEIIISDNASTDATGEICRRLAGSDNRIRYYRATENMGPTANFVRVLKLAQGRYFMWASGHDLWSPDLVRSCVERLEHHPDAALAFGSTRWIDAQGQPYPKESGHTDTRGMDIVARFFTVLWGNMHPVLGVIRKAYLDRIPRIHGCAGFDLLILADLALMGDFLLAPEAYWCRRQFRLPESHRDRMRRYKSQEYALARTPLDRYFPLLRLPIELIRIVMRAPIPRYERWTILTGLLPQLPVRYLAGRRAASGGLKQEAPQWQTQRK